MVTLHEVITFLVSMQISISSLQTHNVNRCGRSRHLARKLSLRRKRSSPNVFEMAATETITSIILIKLIRVRSEERFSRKAETDLVCRLLLETKNRESLVFRRVLVSTSLWPTNTVPKFRIGAAMDRLPLCETVGWVALKPWQPHVAANARSRA